MRLPELARTRKRVLPVMDICIIILRVAGNPVDGEGSASLPLGYFTEQR